MALISTLTDNFNDNSIDGAKWTADAGVSETNNQIEIATLTGGSDRSLISANTYDLTGSQVTIKIIDAGNNALASYEFYPIEFSCSGGFFSWKLLGDGSINARIQGSYIATATYVAATYRYLKIREAAGTTYWDYSADGINWSNFASYENNAGINAVTYYCELAVGAEASTTTAKVDDFNILPSAGGFMTTNTKFW